MLNVTYIECRYAECRGAFSIAQSQVQMFVSPKSAILTNFLPGIHETSYEPLTIIT
jgi:hypothetical protein